MPTEQSYSANKQFYISCYSQLDYIKGIILTECSNLAIQRNVEPGRYICINRIVGQKYNIQYFISKSKCKSRKNWFQVFHKELMNIKRGERAVGSDISYK